MKSIKVHKVDEPSTKTNDRETIERTKTSVHAVGGDQCSPRRPLLAYMLLLPLLASLLHSQILRTSQIRLLHISKFLINFTVFIGAQIGACVLSLGDFGGATTVQGAPRVCWGSASCNHDDFQEACGEEELQVPEERAQEGPGARDDIEEKESLPRRPNGSRLVRVRRHWICCFADLQNGH